MNKRRRVGITGMGCITPIGSSPDAAWSSVRAGHTGIRRIRAFPTTPFTCSVGAELDDPPVQAAFAERRWRRWDRTADIAVLATEQALLQAALLGDEHIPLRSTMPAIFGTGAGTSYSAADHHASHNLNGPRAVRPTTVPRAMTNVISAMPSIRFGLGGINYVIVAACSASTIAIGQAVRLVRDGTADRVLCGGADTSMTEVNFAACATAPTARSSSSMRRMIREPPRPRNRRT